jgi:hypothetical protein
MAKRPAERYQTISDLVEDLTIAGGIEEAPLPPVPKTSPPDRIVVPTQEAAQFDTGFGETDEVTVVRSRLETTPGEGDYAVPAMSPAAAGLNPWKILIPSLAGLIIVFAVVYAFTRESQPTNTNQVEPSLVADPNSQAVEPSPPATGAAEQGIPAGGTTNTQVADANANANANANVEASPTPDANVNAEENANTGNENTNANSNRPAPNPTLPSPSRQLNTNENPTAPPPGEKPAPSPKPTQTATPDAPPLTLR